MLKFTGFTIKALIFVLYFIVLQKILLLFHSTGQYNSTIQYCTVLYCAALYCIFCTVLYCTVLNFIVLYHEIIKNIFFEQRCNQERLFLPVQFYNCTYAVQLYLCVHTWWKNCRLRYPKGGTRTAILSLSLISRKLEPSGGKFRGSRTLSRPTYT